jgi:hypothetical protein
MKAPFTKDCITIEESCVDVEIILDADGNRVEISEVIEFLNRVDRDLGQVLKILAGKE